jgi:two-component system, cell cycle response regulator DivK
VNQPHALIVEDNARNMQILSSLLAEQGIAHTGVLDPLVVEEVLSRIEHPDVIFLDLEMPGLDGYDVLQLIKSNDRFKNISVVACTVHTSEITTAHERGFDSFLAKPLDPDRFPAQIGRIMRGESVWDRA